AASATRVFAARVATTGSAATGPRVARACVTGARVPRTRVPRTRVPRTRVPRTRVPRTRIAGACVAWTGVRHASGDRGPRRRAVAGRAVLARVGGVFVAGFVADAADEAGVRELGVGASARHAEGGEARLAARRARRSVRLRGPARGAHGRLTRLAVVD